MTYHPREGWAGEGQPRRRPVSRRQFLAGGATASLAAFLAACGSSSSSSQATTATTAPFKQLALPRPDNPVTWPLYTDNKAIASGLAPEKKATLKLYNWEAYINPKVLTNFEKKYNCKVELTTFNTMTEAIAKLESGQFNFDVFVPTVDVLGQLVAGQLIQPLNHSYITNIDQNWPKFTNPFYDQAWQYTVPYTIYTTGIAWRKDHISEGPETFANPWSFYWQSKYKGKVAILDDYREGISLGLLKNGITNLSTSDPAQLSLATNSLLELDSLVGLHIDNNDYTAIPNGQVWIHQAWSGDMAAAANYVPKGTPVDVVGYWFPTNNLGPVANDTMTVLKGAQNPVLAHLFINYLQDEATALTNIGFNGYMQPITTITPELLVQQGILPPSLIRTAVVQADFTNGLFEGQLAPATDARWQQDWLRVSSGV